MTCLALGLCLTTWLWSEPQPPAIPVHVVKTVTISVEPKPVYPCGEQQ